MEKLMEDFSVSTLHNITAETVVNFLKDINTNEVWLNECTQETKSLLKRTVEENKSSNVECMNWTQILDALKALCSREVRKTDPLVEYSCLLAEEQLLQHTLLEESLQLQLAQRKVILFHYLDQMILKASCLGLCVEQSSINGPDTHVAHPSSSLADFLQQLVNLQKF